MAANLDNYIEVKDRIAALYKKYPDASIQGSYEFVQQGEKTLIVYCSKVYRTPDDRRPAIAYAAEPFPGKTNFTRDSELQNAETSAIGRAIAALGFEVHKSVASRQEVQARQPDPKPEANGGLPPGDVAALMSTILEKKKAGMNFSDLSTLLGSVGIDAPPKNSVKSLEETVAHLDGARALALERALEGWA